MEDGREPEPPEATPTTGAGYDRRARGAFLTRWQLDLAFAPSVVWRLAPVEALFQGWKALEAPPESGSVHAELRLPSSPAPRAASRPPRFPLFAHQRLAPSAWRPGPDHGQASPWPFRLPPPGAQRRPAMRSALAPIASRSDIGAVRRFGRCRPQRTRCLAPARGRVAISRLRPRNGPAARSLLHSDRAQPANRECA